MYWNTYGNVIPQITSHMADPECLSTSKHQKSQEYQIDIFDENLRPATIVRRMWSLIFNAWELMIGEKL